MIPRIKFLSEPLVFMENGLMLPNDLKPSMMACRTFFCKIIEELFVSVNPPREHLCSARCFDELQIIIGKPGKYAHDLVPREV